jgi:hypothetical protein
LTRHFAKHSISPESSDGFASVGTILPKEEVALLPGGLFMFLEQREGVGSMSLSGIPENKQPAPGNRDGVSKLLIMLGLAVHL